MSELMLCNLVSLLIEFKFKPLALHFFFFFFFICCDSETSEISVVTPI